MTLIALALTAVLVVVAAAHAAWGFGVLWPVRDKKLLARTVVGAKGIEHMPSPLACFAVAFVLLAIACWPLWRLGWIKSPLPDGLSLLAGSAIAAGFATRFIASFSMAWRRRFPEEPFATLDRQLYGPLCLALAAGFVALRIWGGSQ